VRVELACDEAEMDEQWAFVDNKSNQRWLWYAVDHATNIVLAYVFDKRKDEVFKALKALLEPFGISRYYTDDWRLMSVTLKAISMRWVSATLKRLNAKI
jgi:insertion element IS1 protein InsB